MKYTGNFYFRFSYHKSLLQTTCTSFRWWSIFNRHRKHVVLQYIQDQRGLQNHNNASTQELFQNQEYSWCLLYTHSQTSSLFPRQNGQCGNSMPGGGWASDRTETCNFCMFWVHIGLIFPKIQLITLSVDVYANLNQLSTWISDRNSVRSEYRVTKNYEKLVAMEKNWQSSGLPSDCPTWKLRLRD